MVAAIRYSVRIVSNAIPTTRAWCRHWDRFDTTNDLSASRTDPSVAPHAILAADDFVGLPEPVDQFAFVHFENGVTHEPYATSARGFTS